MRASASFSLDDGMRTVSCMATLALRMRVSMSAMGSVIVIGPPPPGLRAGAPSPARLRHTGHLAGVDELPQTDPAQTELPVHRARSPAAAAAGVGADPELGLALLLLDECLLGH